LEQPLRAIEIAIQDLVEARDRVGGRAFVE